jgi:hypothetical protein
MKKYLVFWIGKDNIERSNQCETIEQAVHFWNTVDSENKYIFKLVTWKTEITDVTP